MIYWLHRPADGGADEKDQIPLADVDRPAFRSHRAKADICQAEQRDRPFHEYDQPHREQQAGIRIPGCPRATVRFLWVRTARPHAPGVPCRTGIVSTIRMGRPSRRP